VVFEPVQKNVASGFGDVEQADGHALQRGKPRQPLYRLRLSLTRGIQEHLPEALKYYTPAS